MTYSSKFGNDQRQHSDREGGRPSYCYDCQLSLCRQINNSPVSLNTDFKSYLLEISGGGGDSGPGGGRGPGGTGGGNSMGDGRREDGNREK